MNNQESSDKNFLLNKNNTGRPDFGYINGEIERRFFRLLYAIGKRLKGNVEPTEDQNMYTIPSDCHSIINKIEHGLKIRIGYHNGTVSDGMAIIKDTMNSNLVHAMVCSEELEILLDALEVEVNKIPWKK